MPLCDLFFRFANFKVGKMNFKVGKINFKVGKINFKVGKINFKVGKINFEVGKIYLLYMVHVGNAWCMLSIGLHSVC